MSETSKMSTPGGDALPDARERMLAFRERGAAALAERMASRPGLADWSLDSIGPVLAALAASRERPAPKRRFAWGSAQAQPDVDPATVEAAAFYLGESFVRAFPSTLRWELLRDRDLGDHGAPVVTGFENDDHLLVARVGDVLVHRARDLGPQAISEVIAWWRERVPKA